MSNGLGSKKLAQVAIVVHDIEEAKKRYSNILGLDPPATILTAPGLEVNQTYEGSPSNAQAKLAFFELENVQIELIEPVGESSSWYEVLTRRGEGVHHIAFWVEDMKSSMTFLAGQGIPLVHRGDMGEGQFAYFNSESQLGLVVELLEKVRTPLDS